MTNDKDDPTITATQAVAGIMKSMPNRVFSHQAVLAMAERVKHQIARREVEAVEMQEKLEKAEHDYTVAVVVNQATAPLTAEQAEKLNAAPGVKLGKPTTLKL